MAGSINIAYFNGVPFPYLPNSIDWSYSLNKASFNTIGGRVTQILSIKINTVSWTGDAGSRQNLLNLYSSFKDTQAYQVKNEVSSPLVISSRPDWVPQVFARSMELGWDYQSVTYPYRIQFEVDEDFASVTNGQMNDALNVLSATIGWSKDFSGLPGGTQNVNTDPANALKDILNNSESNPTQ